MDKIPKIVETMARMTVGISSVEASKAAINDVSELLDAMPDLLALYLIKWGNLDLDATAIYERAIAAYRRCTEKHGDSP